MSKFREKLVRFMYGRYGADELYNFIAKLNFVFIIVALLLTLLPVWRWLVYAFYIFIIAIDAWMIFRMLSKNIDKRRKENAAFIKFRQKAKAGFNLTVNRIKFIRTHRFRTCPHCGAVLRLPRKKGRHSVCCPCCRKRFEVRVRF